MRMLKSLILSAVFAGGCVVVHDNNPPPPGPPPPTPPPAQIPTYRIQPGAGTVVFPGTQAGFGITANVGGSYRLVWTGDAATSGTYSNFTGYVYTPGSFTVFDPGCGGGCPLEGNDYVYQPAAVSGGGEEIDFDTIATDGLDGFDFGVDTEPVTFDLVIDGVRYQQLVFFTSGDTGQTSSPESIPFALQTQ